MGSIRLSRTFLVVELSMVIHETQLDPERALHEKRLAFERDASEVFLPDIPVPFREIPQIPCDAFGKYAPQIMSAVEVFQRFLGLPVRPYRFTSHHAWSAWKVAMREKYGEAFANTQLKAFESNKLRVNSLSWLPVRAESLIMALERGSEEDRDFAARLDDAWKPSDVLRAIEEYRNLPIEEGIQRMAYFDEKALEFLRLLQNEADLRLGAPQRETSRVYNTASLAK